MLKITIDTSGLDSLRSQVAQAASKAETAVAVQAEKDTRPYVPMLEGSLNGRTQVVGNRIIYPGPYARFLYYGKLMVDPDTGSPWARAGASKVVTNQDLIFTQDFHPQAQSHWFEASKAENLEKWMRVAEKAVALDG